MPGFSPASTAPTGMTRDTDPVKQAVTAGLKAAPTESLRALSGLLGKAAKSKITPAEKTSLKTTFNRVVPGLGLAAAALLNGESAAQVKTWVDAELATRNAKPTPEFQPSQADLPPVATPGATVATVPATEVPAPSPGLPWKWIAGGTAAVLGTLLLLSKWK